VGKIVFTRQAAKSLQRIPLGTVSLIRVKLDEIASDPNAQHPNATKLQGRPGYRLRVGNWRIIHDIRNDELVILVLKITPRGEVCR
jgi:mRNA interferase RelE/StbE